MYRLFVGCAVVALGLGFAASAGAQAVPLQAIPPQVGARQAMPVLSEDEAAIFSALGSRFTNAASVYEGYQRRASAINPRFVNAAAVRDALRAGSAFEPRQLQEGLVAYAALLALRDADFVDGVRAMQGFGFAERLIARPEAVLSVRGADQAAARVAGVLDAQSGALLASGRAITQSAYDVQHQSWSTVLVADKAQVLSEAKAAAAQSRSADAPTEKLLLLSIASAPSAPAHQASATSPDVVRGLALAALAVLGRTGDRADADVDRLLFDSVSADCLELARMNLNQCLAAAGPSYEDAFCLGRHAVSESGQCMVSAIDAAPVEPAPRLRMASLDSYGSGRAARDRWPRDDVQRQFEASGPPMRTTDAYASDRADARAEYGQAGARATQERFEDRPSGYDDPGPDDRYRGDDRGYDQSEGDGDYAPQDPDTAGDDDR
jgi:hypothetical protein